MQTNQETNDWERKKVGVIKDMVLDEQEREFEEIGDNPGLRSLSLNSIRNSNGSHAP